MNLYMFRTVPLPIIRSSLTVHLALVYVIRFEDSFRAGAGWNSFHSGPARKLSSNRMTYRMSQEECARLREGVPYVKVYRYNPKHLCPKLNSYGDNGQRKVWFSGGSTNCTCQLTTLSMSVLECGFILRQFSSHSL